MKDTCYIRLAGVTVRVCFRYRETADRFGCFLLDDHDPAIKDLLSLPAVALDDEDTAIMERSFEPEDIGSFSEFNTLAYLTSSALIRHARFLFHGAAMLWRGRAWIFTGDSGVGKTTQLLLWKELFGDEMAVINGDKPACEVRGDEIIVHPSPWTGKEHYCGTGSGVLGGIIYLEQGKENRIGRMSVRDALVPVFRQFKLFIKTEEEARKVARLEEKLLANIPVWHLLNLGDKDSVFLTRKVLLKNMVKD